MAKIWHSIIFKNHCGAKNNWKKFGKMRGLHPTDCISTTASETAVPNVIAKMGTEPVMWQLQMSVGTCPLTPVQPRNA